MSTIPTLAAAAQPEVPASVEQLTEDAFNAISNASPHKFASQTMRDYLGNMLQLAYNNGCIDTLKERVR